MAEEKSQNIHLQSMRNHSAGLGTYTVDGCGQFLSRDPTNLWCDACGCHQNNHLKLSSEHAALLGAWTRGGQVAERFFDETGVVHQDTIVLDQVAIAAATATAATANADVEDGGEVPVTAAATKHGDATAAATNDGAVTDASVAATGDREDGEDGATGTGNHVAC